APIQSSSGSVPAIKEARDLFEKAAKIATKNALIHASLAEVLMQLGYRGEAQTEIKIAFDNSAGLPREERLRVEATYRYFRRLPPALFELREKPEQPASTYKILFESFPENLEYGLSLAKEQRENNAMSSILNDLRALPPPAPDNPRIDLLESTVVSSLPEAEKLAARAANRAYDLRARMTTADAKAREGHIALLAGNLDRA